MADKPNLRIVDFSDNAFSPAGAKALSYFLANCISLQELRLNNNGLGPEGGKIIANGLVENRKKTLGKASSLRRVTIGRNRLENGSATELAQAFKLHEDLEDVALYQNGIRPEGIVSLAEGLSHCHKLRSLDLQDNTFSDSGSQAIAKVILSWPELLRLNVGDCLVGDRGCRAILEQLVKSPAASKLTHLNLQYAEMESETAKYFASVLPSFLALESLQLNGNCFAADGAEVEAVKSSLKAMNKEAILDELDDMDFEEDSEEEESEEESEEEVVSVVVPAKVEQVVVPVEEEIVVVAKEEPTEEQVQPKAEEAEALAEVTDIIESLTIEDNGMEVTEAETVIDPATKIIKDEEHMEESVVEEVVITEPEQQLDSAKEDEVKEAEESPKDL